MPNRIFLIAVLLFVASAAEAQQPNVPFMFGANQAKDLNFPKSPSPIAAATTQMAMFKPDGAGPFPALILHHQCGGLRSGKGNLSMVTWAREAVKRGYVVLLLDSFGQRDVDSVCMGPKNGVFFSRGARDAFQAAQHLSQFNFVDKKRIAHAGYSWGAMVGAMASGTRYASVLKEATDIAAFISFYPGCFTITPKTGAPYEVLNQDVIRPLLMLMGGKDTETPPSDCIPRLEKNKSSAAPVEWHVYPDATHCWDCAHLNGFSKVDVRGNKVVYRYDDAVTRDSARRMFDFLEKVMPK